MFDVGEQYHHQFIASSRTSFPIPTLPFPLHTNPSFDSHAPPFQPSTTTKNVPKYPSTSTDLADRSTHPWSDDEVLALLKVTSSMEIWFPDFTCEHISRKLEELGFKRSGEECKNKLEEQSMHFINDRIFELDEFCQDQDKVQEEEEDSRNAGNNSKSSNKKRKRREKLEMMKGFCEAVVKTMIAKQEELQQNLILNMVKRDEEKIAREEEWRCQEMNRVKTQIEVRSKEQKSAAERQATIIQLLKQFTNDQDSNTNSINSNLEITQTILQSKPSSPSSPSSIQDYSNSAPITPHQDDEKGGKRWPRDEVAALINLRCKMSCSSNNEEKTSNSKRPLWERISLGMVEMGYKRNAKRCKEKWENINKYFRKTKDTRKKRSANSRTCPYFQQLSCLYSDGTIVGPTQNQTAPTTHDPAS